MTQLALLPARGVVEVRGEDRESFLQGLVSNDVAEAAPGRAVWAALLTPQGKWLADFFILADGARLLLDCEAAQASMLTQRLTRFRLRARVEVRDASAEFAVHVALNGQPLPDCGIAAPDPRLPEAGWRVLAAAPLPAINADAADWDRHRLALGLPDGTRDLEPEKSVLLEAGFDELHGVSWTKGCYMGQELTARTKYRRAEMRPRVANEAKMSSVLCGAFGTLAQASSAPSPHHSLERGLGEMYITAVSCNIAVHARV